MIVSLALRRQAFRDHDTLESLLQGRERIIEWKPELMTAPFLCGGAPRGFGVVATKPMSSGGQRDFMKTSSEEAGLDRK